MSEQFDVIIVGAGPAGLAAGLYAARMELKAVLLDQGPPGGQLLNTELIEDYPGFESVLGTELASRMGDHARRFGLDIREFEPAAEGCRSGRRGEGKGGTRLLGAPAKRGDADASEDA